jgi:hypothetical protein
MAAPTFSHGSAYASINFGAKLAQIEIENRGMNTTK